MSDQIQTKVHLMGNSMNLSTYPALNESPNILSFIEGLIGKKHDHFDREIKWIMKTVEQDIHRTPHDNHSIKLHKELTTIRANAVKKELGLS